MGGRSQQKSTILAKNGKRAEVGSKNLGDCAFSNIYYVSSLISPKKLWEEDRIC